MGKANKVMMNVVQFDMILYFIPLSSSKYLRYKSFFLN